MNSDLIYMQFVVDLNLNTSSLLISNSLPLLIDFNFRIKIFSFLVHDEIVKIFYNELDIQFYVFNIFCLSI